MFFEFIDKYTYPKQAPKLLRVGNKDVFTNDEKIYNEQGYYKMQSSDYPQDEKSYIPTYELDDNIIIKGWEEITLSEEEWRKEAEEMSTNAT